MAGAKRSGAPERASNARAFQGTEVAPLPLTGWSWCHRLAGAERNRGCRTLARADRHSSGPSPCKRHTWAVGTRHIEPSNPGKDRSHDAPRLPPLVHPDPNRERRGGESHLSRAHRHQLGQRRRLGEPAGDHLSRAGGQGGLRADHRGRVDAGPGHRPAHRDLRVGRRGPDDPRPLRAGRGDAPPRGPLRGADPASRAAGGLAAKEPGFGQRPGGRVARLGRARGRLRRGGGPGEIDPGDERRGGLRAGRQVRRRGLAGPAGPGSTAWSCTPRTAT